MLIKVICRFLIITSSLSARKCRKWGEMNMLKPVPEQQIWWGRRRQWAEHGTVASNGHAKNCRWKSSLNPQKRILVHCVSCFWVTMTISYTMKYYSVIKDWHSHIMTRMTLEDRILCEKAGGQSLPTSWFHETSRTVGRNQVSGVGLKLGTNRRGLRVELYLGVEKLGTREKCCKLQSILALFTWKWLICLIISRSSIHKQQHKQL